ncbi:primosome assembly protein PriA [Bifidobacterium sp. DSM 109958]|uniref:Primosome assembly protein PriA n=1 Tax=Bifidobacterium moraviense TaxID=2675323 RepID=A0A7Y0F0T8_9BIFI|nr:primosomal protein N' [Bifidobacterium sp. DSM 109958]NMM99957.1 primosome assembly protein PriA [Bifidobacterium sp. DSM 109958]
MTTQDAEQLTLDGLAPRRRRRAPAQRRPAAVDPIAQVVLDVQATHLGRTFDYLVQDRDDEAARPGVQVRVRFGGQRLTGVIWNRTATSPTPSSSLRYLERVLSPVEVVGEEMRGDIEAVADWYGGTRANILRVAVPARVARVEREQELAAGGEGFAGSAAERLMGVVNALGEREWKRVAACYDRSSEWRDALTGRGFAEVVADALPGPLVWARDAAWMIAEAMGAGRSAVTVLPDMRRVEDLAEVLEEAGLRRFAPSAAQHGGWIGDFVVLGAALPPAERYRAYLAVAAGQVRCVIGTRAAMYAPVRGAALFAIVDDVAYQNADGFMPYAQARGVLRLRARRRGGAFVALAHARSPISEASGATKVHALPTVTKESLPWVRWLNRETLASLGDPTAGARVPHTAVRALSAALQAGPVLMSIPAEGVGETLSCASCHRQARCPRCTGPLALRRDEGAPRCMWCGAAAVGWHCAECGRDRMRVVRVGAAGTAAELEGLFRGVPVVVSSPRQPGGVVESVADRPQLVIATPGAEPRVRPVGGGGRKQVGYQAVAILDAWTSLYAMGVDARTDTLTAWMRAVALCRPRTMGGQALLLGETDPVLAQSLMLWNAPMLASREVAERRETGLPPAVAAACVWGRRDAVMWLLEEIGALTGDWTVLDMPSGEAQPGVLGPVPIAQPATISARELEETADRVKAVVRVTTDRRAELALRLRTGVAKRVASRMPGELRFQVDPKDLI